jgi:molybdopterin molybdotransferase
MISVKEAKAILEKNLHKLSVLEVLIEKSVGMVLAQDVFSPTDVPAFDNSAMDGYAFCYQDFLDDIPFTIAYEIPAGKADPITLKRGEAARIFTGAAIPGNADTVVMQEFAQVSNKQLQITGTEIKCGDHVRKKASQTKINDLVLKNGIKITPAIIGFLAGLGIPMVKCYAKPRVYLLTSGNELVLPGLPLMMGQIYESSSYALSAALFELNVELIRSPILEDNKEVIFQALDNAIQNYDMVLITGGISVGEYDFVYEALTDLKVDQLFYKVKQKPGKPLYAGKKGDKLIFALPGNPNSTLTCFYQYVKPALEIMQGKIDGYPTPMNLHLKNPYKKGGGLTHFVKGYFEENEVEIFSEQESFKMNGFAKSNCIIELKEDLTSFEVQDRVNVYEL